MDHKKVSKNHEICIRNMEVISCDLSLGKTLDMPPKLQMKKLKIYKKGYIEFLVEQIVELIYFI